MYVVDNPDLSKYKFDLIYVFFWGEAYHLKYVEDPKRIIKQITSHRWYNESVYGNLAPKNFVDKYLKDAGTLAAVSKKLQSIVNEYRPTFYIPQGVDTEKFKIVDRVHPNYLRIGWVGNIEDTTKGINDIIIPAATNYELKIASGDINHADLCEFYNDIDVLAIASEFEGLPNPLLEAMSCGNFIVSTDVGIVPEIVASDKEGIIVKRNIADFSCAFDWCQQNLDYIRSTKDLRRQLIYDTRRWQVLKAQNEAPIEDALIKLNE